MAPTLIDPDRALFEGELDALVVACYVNERPLGGLAGLMDWRFQGVLSRCLRAGAMTGKEGECVYVPARRAGGTFHLILVGGGYSPAHGKRGPLPAESLKALKKNLATLQLKKVGISRADLGIAPSTEGIGGPEDGEVLEKHLKGMPLCLTT